jgi:hypothetical protein
MTQREIARLLALLLKLSEKPGIDGAVRDDIARIRSLLWEMADD